MNDGNASLPGNETISQRELFSRFLDAPYRAPQSTSSLVGVQGTESSNTPRGEFLSQEMQASGWYCFSEPPYCPQEALALEICESESPLYELGEIIFDLERMLENFIGLRREFQLLCDATRTVQPSKNATDQESEEWEDNPAYVVARCSTGVASKREFHVTDLRGNTHTGQFRVVNGILAAEFAGRSKRTQIGNMNPLGLAKMILAEMILEGAQ